MKCGECTLTYAVAESLICKVDGEVKKPDDTCSLEDETCEECNKQHREICQLMLKRIPDIETVPDWCPKKGEEKE